MRARDLTTQHTRMRRDCFMNRIIAGSGFQ
jgi:hypothetical protein